MVAMQKKNMDATQMQDLHKPDISTMLQNTHKLTTKQQTAHSKQHHCI